jgi:hypothetical protein
LPVVCALASAATAKVERTVEARILEEDCVGDGLGLTGCPEAWIVE